MSEREHFQHCAMRHAQLQACWLMQPDLELVPDTTLPDIAQLIHDCVYHLGLPELAVRLALHFQPHVERWAAWGTWAGALDTALLASRQQCTQMDEIRLLNYRSQAARELGDYAVATATATTALQLATQRDDPALMAMALNKLGRLAWKRDDFQTAHQYLKQAYVLGKQHLPQLELGHISLNLGWIAVEQAQLEDAQQYLKCALHYYEASNDLKCMAQAQCNLVELNRRQGSADEALFQLQAARNVFAHAGDQKEQAWTENDLGCAYLKLQQWQRAHAHFDAALALFEQLGSLTGKVWVLSNVVELLVTKGDWEKAAPMIVEARALAVVCEQLLIATCIDVDHGRMLAAQGYIERARELWQSALRVQDERGALLAVQQTRALLATLPA